MPFEVAIVGLLDNYITVSLQAFLSINKSQGRGQLSFQNCLTFEGRLTGARPTSAP